MSNLSISIIITNYNYGHFLASCLESSLAQTVSPDEIIVVDDGSTDGSAAVLDLFKSRVRVVQKSNGGQASAFNAGFARSTSALVIFLDADDLLRPEAVETVLTWWRPGIVSLSYWLELIDIAGRSRGIYEETLRVDDGDKRQRLIDRGVFAFAPTSGNVFSREFLQTILPLDEKRWRISADLPLTYAAGLHGRTLTIPQALGAYRTHGNNNYYRERLPSVWRLYRGMRDVVDALAYLADEQQKGDGATEAPLLALALRYAALRMRVKLLALEGRRNDLTVHVRRELRKILRAPLPLPLRLASSLPFILLGLGGWRSAWLRRWLADSRSLPAFVHRVARFCRETRPNGSLARLAALQRPRWTPTLPFDVNIAPDFNGLFASMMAEGWSGEMSDTLHWSSGAEAFLEFKIDAQPHGVQLDFVLVIHPDFKGTVVLLETQIGDRRLTSDRITDQGTVSVDLSRQMAEAEPVVRLRLVCRAVAPARSRLRTLIWPEPTFAIRACRLRSSRLPPSFPLLTPGCALPFSSLLPTDGADAEWRVDPDGTAWLLQSEAACRVTVAPHPDPMAITFTVADTKAVGWLRISCGRDELFSGHATAGATLQCQLSPIADADSTGLDVLFTFTASDPTETARFGLTAVGLVTVQDVTRVGGADLDRSIRLNIGERIDLAITGRSFGGGRSWIFDELSGWSNQETEASFTVRLPQDCVDPVLHLSLDQLVPQPDGHHHVVAVSSNDEVLVSARLEGPGDLDINVPPRLVGPSGALSLTLHSIFVAEAVDPDRLAPPLFAGVGLRAISLSARPPLRDASTAARLSTWSGSTLHQICRSLRGGDPSQLAGDRPALRRIRENLATAIWTTDARALESHLMDPAFLDEIEGLGSAAAAIPLSQTERALLRRIEAAAPAPGVLLRQMLASMTMRAVATIPALIDFGAFPSALLWSTSPLARFLASQPPASAGETRPSDTTALLENVLSTLRMEPRTSRRYELAVRILEHLGPGSRRHASGGTGEDQALWARSVELHLTQSGCMLAAAFDLSRPRLRRRIGLLVRDARRGAGFDLASGLAAALDGDAFEPVLICLSGSHRDSDAADVFGTAVDLLDPTVQQGASRVRALDLDILLIAAPLRRMDKLAAIAAHHLAPVQMLLASTGWGKGLHSLSETNFPRSLLPHRAPLAGLQPKAQDHLRVDPKDSGALTAFGSSAREALASTGLAELWTRALAGSEATQLLIAVDPATIDGEDTCALRISVGLWCRELKVAEDRITFLESLGDAGDWPEAIDLYLGILDDDAGDVAMAIRAGIPSVFLADPGGGSGDPPDWASCLLEAGLAATSREAYVQSVLALAADPEARRQRQEEIAAALARSNHVVDHETVAALHTAFKDLAAR